MPLTDDLLESINIPCDLATTRMGELVAAIEDWEAGCVVPVRTEEGPASLTLWALEPPRPPRIFAILAAEAIHHLSAASDHIAWALVSDEARQDQRRNRFIYMPFTRDEANWEKDLARELPGIKDSYVPLVQELQPFFLSKVHARLPLNFDVVIMQDFDTFAKHRSHHVLSVTIENPMWVTLADTKTDVDVSMRRRLGTFENGQELLFVGVDPTLIAFIAPPAIKVLFRASDNMAINGMFEEDAGFPVRQLERSVGA